MNKKKNKFVITILSIIVFVLLVLASCSLFSVIISLGILPLKYLLPLLVVIVLIYFGIGKIIFSKKIRDWCKVVISILCIGLLGVHGFAYYYLDSTLHFMDKITSGKYQIENYYILTKKDSEVIELTDINKIGLYAASTYNYDDVLEKIDVETNYKKKEFSNYIDLVNSLLNHDVDAILLSASYKDIVSEMISDFENNVEIIYTIEIKSKSEVDSSDVNITSDAFNVYISGIDIYGDINMVSRSDVNMIMSVNPKTHDLLLTSIPRDYYVQLHGTTGSRDKLTHAGLYGIDMSIKTIEDLLDEKIDYYVRVNFTTLISLVDAIGGIDIYSDTAFTAWTDRECHYQVGMMHLDGKCALAFARERMVYIDGDRHRVKNQQDVISAIIKKAMSSRTLITKYTNILESMENSFQTNISTEEIYSLINMQLNSMPSWNFNTYSLNGFDSENGTYTFGDQQLYVMEPDMNTVEEARNKIDFIMNK